MKTNFQKTSRKRVGLRMAPLIDIIFLLLIFFLVTAKWRPEESHLPLKLTTASAQTIQAPKAIPLELNITTTDTGCSVNFSNNSVTISDNTIDKDLQNFLESLNNVLEKHKRLVNDPIEIYCDTKVKWLYLARIYNDLYGAGFTDITFAVYEK